MHIKHSKYIFHQMATQIAWSTRRKHTHQAGKALGTANVSVAESAQMLGSGVGLQNSGQQRGCSLIPWRGGSITHARQGGGDGMVAFCLHLALLWYLRMEDAGTSGEAQQEPKASRACGQAGAGCEQRIFLS